MSSSPNDKIAKSWYDQDLNYDHKEIKLEIFSARPVEDQYLKEIAQVLSQKYNFVPHPVVNVIDPSLLGGIKVVFDTKVIDGTIKGKLDNIRKNMSEKGFNN